MSWERQFIGDYVDSGLAHIQTGPFGTQLKASDYVEDGTPVINVRNIGYGILRPDKLEYVGEELTSRLASHIIKAGDIVFGRKGAVDRHLFVDTTCHDWMQGSDCIRLRFNTQKINPRFVSYAFLLDFHQQWILNQAGNKATMASLNQDIIKRIPIFIPSITTQDKIVSILSAYDDLIDNNRKRIALLEKAARLLHEEWFVRLQFPGHEHTPVVDGVPDEWKLKRLDAIADVNSRSLKSNFQGEIEYIDISAVSPGAIDGTTLYEFADAPGRARRIVKHGDIIWSCVRPNRKSYAVIWEPKPGLIASTGFAVLSPVEVPTSFLLQATTTDEFVGYLNNNARGAAYPAVTAKDFGAAQILVPSRSLLEAFDTTCNTILSQVKTLGLQNQKLQQARDLLLPRLMSGALAV